MNIHFSNFYECVKEFYSYYRQQIHVEKDIVKTLHKLNKLLLKVLDLDRQTILEYKGELLQIHCLLAGKVIKLYFQKNEIDKIRSAHDKLFKHLGIKNPIAAFKHVPTEYFTDFIEGITYFRNEETNEKPIYHRDISCGTGTKKLLEKFEIFNTNTDVTINEKRNYVRRCYIERLIYNEIYMRILFEQDVGHLIELQDTERLYQQYFPGESVKIEMSFIGAKPVKVKFFIIKGISLQLEHYTKVGKVVQCLKVDEQKRIYEKVQSVDQESPWIESNTLMFKEVLDNEIIHALQSHNRIHKTA